MTAQLNKPRFSQETLPALTELSHRTVFHGSEDSVPVSAGFLHLWPFELCHSPP
jgi:hypothetical protein